MYKIEKQSYGYQLTFEGFIKSDEMQKWVEESKKALIGVANGFGVLIDMRSLKALPPDSQEYMQHGQKLYKDKGMARSCVVVSSQVTLMQFQRIAKETGIYEWERYVNASATADWEKVAIGWIDKSIDPDK